MPPSEQTTQSSQPVSQQSQAARKKPVALSYEDYKKMTNLILIHMKQQEQLLELGVYRVYIMCV